jgi:acyl carrier protein
MQPQDSIRRREEVINRLSRHLQRFARPGIPIDADSDLVARLGLDSIKVLDLIMEVEDEFDISIPMNTLADVRTVHDLADAVLQVLGEAK